MIIQWFPGHMTKALRMMEKELKAVDVIVYVLDSRAPFSCVNPKLNSLVGNKPVIYVFNKADLGDDRKIDSWMKYFSEKGKCIKLNSVQSGTAKRIESAMLALMKDKIDRKKEKNINAFIRGMVLGVPNSGKSTIINNMCNKGKTQTGNKPGVTRGKQWVALGSGIEMLDTPGTLWPAFNNSYVAQHLAYIGSIRNEVLDIPELSIEFIKEIMEMYPEVLVDKYKIEVQENTALEILEKICKARGYMLKGAEYDYDRASIALINDFRKGKLGKITLEDATQIKKLSVKDRKKAAEEEN